MRLLMSSQVGRFLGFEARSNESKRCDQTWQKAQYHTDSEGTGRRVERCFLGGQSGNTVENTDANKAERETHG